MLIRIRLEHEIKANKANEDARVKVAELQQKLVDIQQMLQAKTTDCEKRKTEVERAEDLARIAKEETDSIRARIEKVQLNADRYYI